MIWREGYACGALQSHVYPDAVAGLRRWHAQGHPLAVYSSGSVEAQKQLFGHTQEGDLRALFGHWFDTRVGGKREQWQRSPTLARPSGGRRRLERLGA